MPAEKKCCLHERIPVSFKAGVEQALCAAKEGGLHCLSFGAVVERMGSGQKDCLQQQRRWWVLRVARPILGNEEIFVNTGNPGFTWLK